MFCINLTTGDKMYFSENTSPEHAAAYGHYMSNNMGSWFFDLIHTNQNWADQINWERGKCAICVSGSDWYAPLQEFPETL